MTTVCLLKARSQQMQQCTLIGLAATVWLDRLLIEAGLPELATVLSRGNLTSAVAGVSAATVGAALVASRRPATGWDGCWSP